MISEARHEAVDDKLELFLVRIDKQQRKIMDNRTSLPQREGRNFIPPPPPLVFGQKAFAGRGGGEYILNPPAAGVLNPPRLLYAPTPRRIISPAAGVLNVGGGGL